MSSKLFVTCTLLLLGVQLFVPANSDIAQDKAECADKLVGLAPCLPYVGGTSGAKAPTPDCCTGLKGVLDKSRKCLCLLVKDKDDPSLGLKINSTLALGLPDKCNTPANISECPELLNLPPNSPDAKVFQDFTNSAKGSKNTTSTPAASVKGSPSGVATSPEVKSEGCKRKRLMILNVAMWLLLCVFNIIFTTL